MTQKCEKSTNRRNKHIFMKILNRIDIMLCSVCILFISSLTVKISAITVYQNITSEAHKTVNQSLTNHILTTAVQPAHKKINNFITRVINNNLSKLNHNIDDNSTHNMLANSTLRKYEEEQQKLLQGQHPTYLRHIKSHAMNSVSETDYLLERNNNKSLNEQAGMAYDDHDMQLTKAKQSDPSLSSISHERQRNVQQQPFIDGTIIDVLDEIHTDDGFVEPTTYDQTGNTPHYEGLNVRRPPTTKPSEVQLHNQIPRPPPPLSTTALRRQFNEEQPKPFHFPYDGPQPEEFKKVNEGEVNNIQDLLHNLYLNEMLTTRVPPPAFQPPLIMPTGLHISGSYKNLKSSGFLNFLRNKRQKTGVPSMWQQPHQRYPQHYGPHTMPAPLHIVNSYPTPINLGIINSYLQPHQRLSMDQFYPFKPKSLNDINLLQQQQQQHQYQSMHNFKPKKNKKKQKMNKQNIWPPASYGAVMPTFVGDTYPAASLYSPFMSYNISQLPLAPQPPPPPLTKRLPFNVNLDVFPIIPPTKIPYRIPRPTRDMGNTIPLFNTAKVKNPFTEYFTTAPATGNSDVHFYNHNYNHQPVRFPGHIQSGYMAQPSNNMINYASHPMQIQKYLPFSQPKYQSTVSFPTNDCEQQQATNLPNTENVDSRTSPILLNLNVFPKHKETSVASEQTNPFYANLVELQRSTHREIEQGQQQEQEQQQQQQQQLQQPQYQQQKPQDIQDINSAFNAQTKEAAVDFNYANQHTTNLARSDSTNSISMGQPNITAKGLSSTQSPLMQGKRQTRNYSNISKQPTPADSNKNYMINMKITEVHDNNKINTESQFRFPVEDLITFQVQDAL